MHKFMITVLIFIQHYLYSIMWDNHLYTKILFETEINQCPLFFLFLVGKLIKQQ